MAVRLWLSKPTDAQPAESAKPSSRATSVLGGYLVGISNPQPLLCYSSIVPMVVTQGLNGFGDLVILWLIVIIGFALITLFYMSLATVLKRWLDKAANRLRLNRAMAAVFVILALVIALG